MTKHMKLRHHSHPIVMCSTSSARVHRIIIGNAEIQTNPSVVLMPSAGRLIKVRGDDHVVPGAILRRTEPVSVLLLTRNASIVARWDTSQQPVGANA